MVRRDEKVEDLEGQIKILMLSPPIVPPSPGPVHYQNPLYMSQTMRMGGGGGGGQVFDPYSTLSISSYQPEAAYVASTQPTMTLARDPAHDELELALLLAEAR